MGMFPVRRVRPATGEMAGVTHDSRRQFRYAVEEALEPDAAAGNPPAHL